MIKKTKKLSLNKETVQSMDSQNHKIKGGKDITMTLGNEICCCNTIFGNSGCKGCYPTTPVNE